MWHISVMDCRASSSSHGASSSVPNNSTNGDDMGMEVENWGALGSEGGDDVDDDEECYEPAPPFVDSKHLRPPVDPDSLSCKYYLRQFDGEVGEVSSASASGSDECKYDNPNLSADNWAFLTLVDKWNLSRKAAEDILSWARGVCAGPRGGGNTHVLIPSYVAMLAMVDRRVYEKSVSNDQYRRFQTKVPSK